MAKESVNKIEEKIEEKEKKSPKRILESDKFSRRVPERKVQRRFSGGGVMRVVVAIAIVIFLVVAVGVSWYFYSAYKKTLSEKDALLSGGGQSESMEIEKTVSAIAKLIELPTDETPTLATVTDKSKLDSQPFFRRAENGDKVLIYTVSGRAILYRPATGKVVDITLVNTTNSDTNNEPTNTNNEPPKETDAPKE